MNAKGTVLKPLDEAEVQALAKIIAAQNIEAVAVCFLHAYANGLHERQMREVLARVLTEKAVATAVPTVVLVFPSDRAFTPIKPKFNGKVKVKPSKVKRGKKATISYSISAEVNRVATALTVCSIEPASLCAGMTTESFMG